MLALLLLEEGGGLVVEELLLLEGARPLPPVVEVLSFLDDDPDLGPDLLCPSRLDCVERTSDGEEEPRALSLLSCPNCGEFGIGIVGLQYPSRVRESGI